MHLAVYERAKQAVAEYETVDELKDYRDKAFAVEQYAKQANDWSLERSAAVARIRAERRCGELLIEIEFDAGGRPATGTKAEPVKPSLNSLGLTKKQSSTYQALARIPEQEFEATIDDQGDKPNSTRLATGQIRKERGGDPSTGTNEPMPPPPRMDQDAFYLWGQLQSMEKLFSRDVNELIGELTPSMQGDVRRIIPALIDWASGAA